MSPPSFAVMSASQRAQSMDNIVKQVALLTEASNAHHGILKDHTERHNGTQAFLERGIAARLRWILTGR